MFALVERCLEGPLDGVQVNPELATRRMFQERAQSPGVFSGCPAAPSILQRHADPVAAVVCMFDDAPFERRLLLDVLLRLQPLLGHRDLLPVVEDRAGVEKRLELLFKGGSLGLVDLSGRFLLFCHLHVLSG